MSPRQTIPRSYLLELPNELLSQILGYVAIWDCHSLRDTQKRSRFSTLIQDRKAFHLHLNKYKFNGSEWLEILCPTGAYLVEERAFEFICPGSAPNSSAWKFVLSKCARRIEKFVKFMEGEGFRWDTYHDVIQANVVNEYFYISRERLAAADALTNNSRLPKLSQPGENSSSPYIKAEPLANGDYSYTPADQIVESYFPRDFFVHKGQLTRDGMVHYIELIYPRAEHLSPRDYLLRLPYSAAQCFVSGFGGVHMYGDATAKQELICWRKNASGTTYGLPRESHEWEHAIRDIQMEQPTGNYIARHTLDTASLLIEWPHHIKWPLEFWNCASRQSLYSGYVEKNGGTQSCFYELARHLGPSSTDAYVLFRSSFLPRQPDKVYLLGHGIEAS